MIKKENNQFTIRHDFNECVNIYDGERVLCCVKSCYAEHLLKRLNELYDSNDYNYNVKMDLMDEIGALIDDKENLKKSLNYYKTMYHECKPKLSYILIQENNDLKNENEKITEKNQHLNKLLDLICDIDLYGDNESVKELIKQEITELDVCSHDSSVAWNNYVLLSDFFEEYYGENWGNEE